MTELEQFLDSVIPQQVEAERAICSGDPEARMRLWSHHDPVNVLGAEKSASGWEAVSQIHRWVAAQRFADSYQLRVIAAGVSGDLAYTVGYEDLERAADSGAPRRRRLRATHVYRREHGEWKIVHRHADGVPVEAPPSEPQRREASIAGRGFRLAQGEDRFGEHRSLGIGTLTFKVSTADSGGALVVCEIAHHAKGGPPRHVHHKQDEWFHVVEGEYVIEIAGERFNLTPGDSAFGPRGVPHGWAHLGDGAGRIAFVAAPAGRLEEFFLDITKAGAMAPEDPAFWPPYDMTLTGPPLELP